MSSVVINYGAYQGIQSFPAAVLFAVLYFLLFPFFLYQARTRTTMVYIFAALFCASTYIPLATGWDVILIAHAVRTTSFAVRATIAKSTSAADDAGINISYGVLSGIGFFGVLYSAYTLVLDRYAPSCLIPLRYLTRSSASSSSARTCTAGSLPEHFRAGAPSASCSPSPSHLV
jgi:hypothetical protein